MRCRQWHIVGGLDRVAHRFFHLVIFELSDPRAIMPMEITKSLKEKIASTGIRKLSVRQPCIAWYLERCV